MDFELAGHTFSDLRKLPEGLCSWNLPKASMLFWGRLDLCVSCLHLGSQLHVKTGKDKPAAQGAFMPKGGISPCRFPRVSPHVSTLFVLLHRGSGEVPSRVAPLPARKKPLEKNCRRGLSEDLDP